MPARCRDASSPCSDPLRSPRPPSAHPLRHLRAALLVLTALGSASCAGWSEAHDWVSPRAATVLPQPPIAPPQEPAWSQRVWAGPASGAPAAPDARDCHRVPQTIDLPGPGSVSDRQSRAERDAPGASVRESKRATSRPEAVESIVERGTVPAAPATAATPAPTRPRAADEASAAVAGAAPTRKSLGAASDDVRAAPTPGLPRPRAPVEQAVTAGVVDDNADFGAYLAYRQRHAGLPVRDRDIAERYLLTVHDAQGRPVNDAQVSLHANGRALPLWARTDAGGRVWIHPGVMFETPGLLPVGLRGDDGRPQGFAPRVIEVQVQRGGATGSALLTRGQRDDLQVQLDARVPAQRARLDLAFLVDATGSMDDEIDKLKRSMRAMADQIAQLPSRPDLCFALVAYRDRGDAFFVRATDFSDDLSAFQRTLGALQAGGGGDYPEAMNEALHTAVHRLSWRGDGATRLVVLVADAPPHLDYGSPWYDDDMQGALARGIKLFAVGASGLDPTGEYVFRQAAQYTGGRFVFLTYANAADPSSGPGRETTHDVGRYSVESLDKLVVRLVREELAMRPAS